MEMVQFFHEFLKNDKFTNHLISLFFLDDVRRDYMLTGLEKQAINDAYDYMTMYSALGMNMVGEDTENTKIVAGALAYNYKVLLPYLSPVILAEIALRMKNENV